MARASADDTRVLVHPLAVLRHERGWSFQDVAEIVTRRMSVSGFKPPAHRQIPWRWEHKGVVPDVAAQLALAGELGVAAGVVHERGWPDWLPAGPGIDATAPWDAGGAVRLLGGVAGSAVTDRRGFLLLSGAALASMVGGWLAVEAPRVEHALDGGEVDDGLVGCLEARIPALRGMDMRLGGGSVRAVVDAELELVEGLLASSSFTGVVGARLFGVAAELGRIAGWASFDAGFHAAAQRYWNAALHSAHAAGDVALGANVLKCMSLQLVDTGNAKQALDVAEAARAGASGVATARVRAMLATRVARTHAVLGDRRACEVLLVEADDAMSRADVEAAPDWAGYFDQAEYCAQVAACYLLLAEHARADAWLGRALALHPSTRPRDRATYQMWRADAARHLGDVDLACDLVQQALPDIARGGSDRNVRRLVTIHSQLAAHRTPAVAALKDRVRELACVV